MKGSVAAIKQVDPELNVVSGKKKKSQAEENWDKAQGITCGACGEETQRVVQICPRCFNVLMDCLGKSTLTEKERQVVNFIRARYSDNLKSRSLANGTK